MKIDNSIISGYENMPLLTHNDITEDFPNTYSYDSLPDREITGVLKANKYENGKLIQTYSAYENHVLTIAGTRLGKTSSYVIPTILSFCRQKIKRSLVVTDPKGEIYKITADTLKKQGYDIILFNLRDYLHSEYWNPLTDIFDQYVNVMNVENEVDLKEVDGAWVNVFCGFSYESQEELDDAIDQIKEMRLTDVDGSIDTFIMQAIPPDAAKDPYWNDAAKKFVKALIWSMLEDITPANSREAITRDTFSLSTMLNVLESLTEGERYDDDEFFSGRVIDSRARSSAKVVTENAPNTRLCILSNLLTKIEPFCNSTIRLLTGCNSFSFERLVSDKPVALFVVYPDENKVYYRIISMFIQRLYTYLQKVANDKDSGRLDVPFYFILDEFGNFPEIQDFSNVISACGGRNIWINIVLQSYAQLNSVYGKDIADIIKDNLNVHMFFGSNNPETLEAFSQECLKQTRISPTSALNGSKEEIEQFALETVSVMPQSTLASLRPGDCIVTEVNSGYVLYSRMERYFNCPEFANYVPSYIKDYVSKVNPLDKKYRYKIQQQQKSKIYW